MTMLKRASTSYGQTPEPETPYQRAAKAWDDRIGSARFQASNWRLMAFGCLILAGGFAAALAWQSTRGTIVPWIVEVLSVIRASPDSFRITWLEKAYANGQLVITQRWSAITSLVIDPPHDAERLRKNPLGIYVNAINRSQEFTQP